MNVGDGARRTCWACFVSDRRLCFVWRDDPWLQSDSRESLCKKFNEKESLGTGLRCAERQSTGSHDGLLEKQCMIWDSAHGFKCHANSRQSASFKRQLYSCRLADRFRSKGEIVGLHMYTTQLLNSARSTMCVHSTSKCFRTKRPMHSLSACDCAQSHSLEAGRTAGVIAS
jgi:hypothetical protein